MIVNQSAKSLLDFYISTKYENSIVLVFKEGDKYQFLEVESHDLFRYVGFDAHSMGFFLSMEELTPEEEAALTGLTDPSIFSIYVAGKEATNGYLIKRFDDM